MRALAGRNDRGEVLVLLSCSHCADLDISVIAPHASRCVISSVTQSKEGDPVTETPLAVVEGRVTVKHTGENGVYLLRFI